MTRVHFRSGSEERALARVSKDEAPRAPGSPFPLAFTFGCDLVQTESKIANVKRRAPGKRLWIGFSTSLSLGAASMAAVSRAMRRAGEIMFSFVKRMTWAGGRDLGRQNSCT